MAKWQTHRTQNATGVTPCGFESRSRHQSLHFPFGTLLIATTALRIYGPQTWANRSGHCADLTSFSGRNLSSAGRSVTGAAVVSCAAVFEFAAKMLRSQDNEVPDALTSVVRLSLRLGYAFSSYRIKGGMSLRKVSFDGDVAYAMTSGQHSNYRYPLSS